MSILNPYNAAAIAFSGGDVTNPIGIPNGAVSAPGLYLTNSPTTGFYRIGANILGIVTSGIEALRINDSQNATFAGTVTATGTSVFNSSSGGAVKAQYSPSAGGLILLANEGNGGSSIYYAANSGTESLVFRDHLGNPALTLASTLAATFAGNLTIMGAVINVANLPTIAGASGTLWVDTTAGLNIVKRVT
jgi:hypothetical protein